MALRPGISDPNGLFMGDRRGPPGRPCQRRSCQRQAVRPLRAVLRIPQDSAFHDPWQELARLQARFREYVATPETPGSGARNGSPSDVTRPELVACISEIGSA